MVLYWSWVPRLVGAAGFTPGPMSFIESDHRDDKVLHAHEAMHREQFWRNPFRYAGWLVSKEIRFDLEAEAYAAGVKAGGSLDQSALALADGYQLGISAYQARRAIMDWLR